MQKKKKRKKKLGLFFGAGVTRVSEFIFTMNSNLR